MAREGLIVPLPLVTLIEERVVLEPGAQPARLADLPRFVFEGRRAWLSGAPRWHGGLELLAPEHPFPHGGSCMPDPSVQVPVATTCALCHGPRGDTIEGRMSHGPQRQRVVDDPELQARVTIRQKEAREEFARLRALFR